MLGNRQNKSAWVFRPIFRLITFYKALLGIKEKLDAFLKVNTKIYRLNKNSHPPRILPGGEYCFTSCR